MDGRRPFEENDACPSIPCIHLCPKRGCFLTTGRRRARAVRRRRRQHLAAQLAWEAALALEYAAAERLRRGRGRGEIGALLPSWQSQRRRWWRHAEGLRGNLAKRHVTSTEATYPELPIEGWAIRFGCLLVLIVQADVVRSASHVALNYQHVHVSTPTQCLIPQICHAHRDRHTELQHGILAIRRHVHTDLHSTACIQAVESWPRRPKPSGRAETIATATTIKSQCCVLLLEAGLLPEQPCQRALYDLDVGVGLRGPAVEEGPLRRWPVASSGP
mmetsp:Transcript_47495/g.119697  ORF Transcript_47495/g.119697 Transcript_47495/m.119697 type:complete len:274 (+) Transcript_47495:1155-1976(+)